MKAYELEPAAGPITNDGRKGTILPWPEAQRRIADARYYWLATVHSTGRAHVRPVLAVWVGDALCTSSNPAARKGRNLEHDSHCSIAVSADDMHLVLEGTASKVVDETALERVAEAYRSKYNWPVAVVNGTFEAPYGAPTAGLPPYQPYQIRPATVYGFVNDSALGPANTRWQF